MGAACNFGRTRCMGSLTASMRWAIVLTTATTIALMLLPCTAVATRGLHGDGNTYGDLLATTVPLAEQDRAVVDEPLDQVQTCGPVITGRETPQCRVRPPLNDRYESRVYVAGARWVVARIARTSFDSAARDGVVAAISYFNGKNSEGLTIPLASPVRIQPLGGEFVQSTLRTVKVRVFVPNSFRDPLPAPLDTNVISFEITNPDELRYSTKPILGSPTEITFDFLKAALESDLRRDELRFNSQTFEIASYGAPFGPQPVELWVNGF